MSKDYKNLFYNKYEKFDDDYKKNNHFNKHNYYKNSNYFYKEKNNIKKYKFDNNKFEENRNYYKIEKRENNRNYYDKNRKNSYDYSYSKESNKKNHNKHHYHHYSRSRSSNSRSFKSFSSYSNSKSKSNSSYSTIKNENNNFENKKNNKKNIFSNINNINTEINNNDINNNNINNNNTNNNNSNNINNNLINNNIDNNMINNNMINNNMINNNLNNLYPQNLTFQNLFQNYPFQIPQTFLPSNYFPNQSSIFPQISNYFPSENIKEPSNTLLISNLGADINKEILDDIFREKCIELQTSVPDDIRLIESLGIAYIIFPSIPVCTLVFECLKGKILINGNYYYLNFTPNLTTNNFAGNPHESVTYVTHINKANNFQTSMETTVHEDWYCEYCDCKNFSRRTLCFKCKKPKTINCRIAPVIKQKTTVIGENGAIPPSTSIIVKGEVIKNSNEAEVKYLFIFSFWRRSKFSGTSKTFGW